MLFGGKDDKADEIKKMAEQMQKLSEQIGELHKRLADKTAEADQLRTQVSQGGANQTALDQAHAQMEDLRKQLSDLQAKAQQQTASAGAAVAEGGKSAQSALGAAAGAAPQARAAEVGSTGGLAAGSTAYVTRAGGMSLRLRSGPSLNSSVQGGLPPGTQMTLLEGPNQADGHAWWHIRTSDGRQGWVAGEDLRTQPD